MTAVTAVRLRQRPRSASKDRLRLWIRLLRSSRMIQGEIRERLRSVFEITLPQFDVLAALARNAQGMTMTELSRFLMVSNGNVTGIIDRLVDDGLVMREVIARDRRATKVRLTARGQTHFDGMAKAHEIWIDELLSQFSASDAQRLTAQLDELATRVRTPKHVRP